MSYALGATIFDQLLRARVVATPVLPPPPVVRALPLTPTGVPTTTSAGTPMLQVTTGTATTPPPTGGGSAVVAPAPAKLALTPLLLALGLGALLLWRRR